MIAARRMFLARFSDITHNIVNNGRFRLVRSGKNRLYEFWRATSIKKIKSQRGQM